MFPSPYATFDPFEYLPTALPGALDVYDCAIESLQSKMQKKMAPICNAEKSPIDSPLRKITPLFRQASSLVCQAINYSAHAVVDRKRAKLIKASEEGKLHEHLDPWIKVNLLNAINHDMAKQGMHPFQSLPLNKEGFDTLISYARERSEYIKRHRAMKENRPVPLA